jgi:hypothetical protein
VRGPEDPAVDRALLEVSSGVEELHRALREACPVLRGTLAIPGVFLGYGLGAFVSNGLTDDQIVAHVLSVVAEVRRQVARD